MTDFNAFCTTAQSIARESGAILLHYLDGPIIETTKSTPIDMVTQADKEAEKLIVKRLTAAYPDHHIVAEEGGSLGAPAETAPYRWYVDPLDGTTNFANRIPMFCTSLGLTDIHMNPLLGVIYDPVRDEMFTAIKDQGAFLNGKQIQVTNDTDLETCVLASDFPYDRVSGFNNNLPQWERVLMRSRSLRSFGSAALDLCFVAAGRLDGYWEQTLSAWDCVAGGLCVLEAGGCITDYDGETPETMYSTGQIVATNGKIHNQLLQLLGD